MYNTEPLMCDLCGLHEVEDQDGWCEDCVEEFENRNEQVKDLDQRHFVGYYD